jgi:hypothetical protein
MGARIPEVYGPARRGPDRANWPERGPSIAKINPNLRRATLAGRLIG